MKNIEDYLVEYFNDWDISDEEKLELHTYINELKTNLQGFYSILDVVKNNQESKDDLVKQLDEALQEDKNVKTDT
jgi:hypothetical protein|tara:strand:- start:190 stop:414 length:225 start_codon:yes stop_codon:yes gene_type:complete